jgi:hypothetical protein
VHIIPTYLPSLDLQLLFDVDWTSPDGLPLDALVIDMPPGTGDVQLSLGQLVIVDGEPLFSLTSRSPKEDSDRFTLPGGTNGRSCHSLYTSRRGFDRC